MSTLVDDREVEVSVAGRATRARALLRAARPILLALAVVYASELVLEIPLEVGHVSWLAIPFAPLAFPLGCLFVAVVMTLLLGITGRLRVASVLTLGLAVLVTIADAVKLHILDEPVFPTDLMWLSEPRFLVSMVPSWVLFVCAGLALVLVGALVWWVVLVVRRGTPRGFRWTRAVGRVGLVIVSSVSLWQATQFHADGNPWGSAYQALGASWKPWSQSWNYRDNGFVGGALYNMPITAMPVPAGYSKAAIDQIAAKYEARAQARNGAAARDALDRTNVVVVLSESFGDPASLKGVHLAEDPIPHVRSLIRSGWGGSTLANFYGNGTSAMEWQALSGQYLGLLNPQITTPYAMVVPKLSDYPTAVGWFKEHGHRAIAIHPYDPSMYRRDTVYRRFGFDDFIYDKLMKHKDHVEKNDYISDSAAYAEVLDQIDSSKKPLFANVVTMQNHYPMTGKYDDPIPATGDFDKATAESLSAYARGLAISDHAIDDFLHQLRERDEPTIVVYYGDHYPAVLSNEVLAENPGSQHLRTPLFLWSSQGEHHRALTAASPSTFLPLVFQLAGQQLPPYYELLTELSDEVGAIGPGFVVTPDGRETTEDRLSPEQQALIRDMRLVQYDFSIGERYGVSSMWYDFPQGRG